MSLVICSRPECQTTAGCKCRTVVAWNPAPHAAPAAAPFLWHGSVSAGRTPHKIMTREEYDAMPIKGWHEVCRDIDNAGNVGVRFLS